MHCLLVSMGTKRRMVRKPPFVPPHAPPHPLSCREMVGALQNQSTSQVVELPWKLVLGETIGSGYLGWLMGLEPTTTGITILDSTN